MGGFCSDGCGPKRRIFPGGDCEGCGDELAIYDSVASEPGRLAGTPIIYYRLRRAKHRDPLYKEPNVDGDWEFDGPWEMMAAIEFPQSDNITPEATEIGIQKNSEAVAWISRKEFEDHSAPYPKEGDVVSFWEQPPFGSEEDRSQWDVVKATRDGNVWTAEQFVLYKLELTRRTKFLPIRKTLEDGDE
jgi:hypothetical protein